MIGENGMLRRQEKNSIQAGHFIRTTRF